MKYDEKKFKKEVLEYISFLKGKAEKKILFVELGLGDKRAFFSLAPLSKAVHELGGEMHVVVKDKENSMINVLKKVWKTYDDLKSGLKNTKVAALKCFIDSVVRRTKFKKFDKIFEKPEIMLYAGARGFKGTFKLEYKSRWHKNYRWKALLETSKTIWKQGYNLKMTDNVSIGFVLVPKEKDLELPLEDYLDSYSIALAMATTAKEMKADVALGTSTDKFSVLAEPVRTADLAAMIKGCELEKNINEDVFKKFKVLSKELKINELKNATAGFGIHGKGYFGKHFFGEQIGYPTPNRKSRWLTPGQMALKDRNAPQSLHETRDPLMRYAITETLPIDTFIETCNVDYSKIRRRSASIKKILDKCEYVRVVGEGCKGFKSDFTVYLTDKKGKRREFTAQDSDVRTIVDQECFRKTGRKCGAYANFPSGEAFVTPEEVEGTIVGDVVINVGQSYRIPTGKPIVVNVSKKKGYKVLSAPKKIHDKMKKHWRESKKKISNMEKAKSVPKALTNMYRRNFNRIGEFAVNTNPKAKLSNYLIVNEKIANMIHVALGSGFANDRACVYHWDIVIDAPKQKMDIFGVDKEGKEHWVIKRGKFVV